VASTAKAGRRQSSTIPTEGTGAGTACDEAEFEKRISGEPVTKMGGMNAPIWNPVFDARHLGDGCGPADNRRQRGCEQPSLEKAAPANQRWLECFGSAFLGCSRNSTRGPGLERGRQCLPGQRTKLRVQDLAAAVRSGSRPEGLGLRRRRVMRAIVI
jgi:hypothetical protein